METTVHKSWKIPSLTVRARAFPDFKTSLRKRGDIIAFLVGHGVDLSVAPSPASSAATPPPPVPAPTPATATASSAAAPPVDYSRLKMVELVEHAKQIPGFKKSVHGKNKTTIIAFLAGHAQAPPPPAPVVVPAVTLFTDIENGVRNKTIARPVLLRLAKERGWAQGNKGTIPVLLDFLRQRWQVVQAPPEPERPAVVGEPEWPPVADLDQIAGLPVADIKAILRKHRIANALPSKKTDLLKLFEKKRCNAKNLMACDPKEVCDLRNELCRDDLTNKSTKLQQYSFDGHKFWGSNDIINEIRAAVVERERQLAAAAAAPTPVAQQSTQQRQLRPPSGGVEESKGGFEEDNVASHQEEQEIGRDFVRISDLMEDEDAYRRLLRKAIEQTFVVAEEGTHIPFAMRSNDGKLRPRFRMTMEENSEDI